MVRRGNRGRPPSTRPERKTANPFIPIGHSLGGFNEKLYTALYPSVVAGLILVDPAEERQYERSVATVAAQHGEASAAKSELVGQAWFGWLLSRYGECSQLAPMDPQSDIDKRCSDPVRPLLGPLIAAER